MVVQRDRPAETLPDVILRGQSAAHGLSCPSGHAMVIFAITALVAPTSKAGKRSCLGRWPPRPACHGCTSGRTSRGRRRGAGLGLFIGSALNLVFGVPSASTAGASG